MKRGPYSKDLFTQLSVRISKEMLELLKKEAKERSVYPAALVRSIVREWLTESK